MTVQLSVAVRNGRQDSIETTIGATMVLKMRTGAPPANCAAADTGSVLATITTPSDYLANAVNGSKSKTAGAWEDLSADAAGTTAHFRCYAPDGITCHMQGTVTITSGGGDMTVDNPVFAAGQSFTITSWTMTDGNA